MNSPVVVGLAFLVLTHPAEAATFAEIGDAPALGTGQVIVGIGALDTITGTLSSASDVDLYRIHIHSPAAFAAETFSPLDSQLFLFDANGFGIAANDDQSASLDAGLQVGDPLYSTIPVGDYLLAISAFDVDPIALGSLIFPNAAKGFLGTVGATGPGAAFPVDDWTTEGFFAGSYRIELVAVEYIPEPSPALLVLAGLVALALRRHAPPLSRQSRAADSKVRGRQRTSLVDYGSGAQ